MNGFQQEHIKLTALIKKYLKIFTYYLLTLTIFNPPPLIINRLPPTDFKKRKFLIQLYYFLLEKFRPCESIWKLVYKNIFYLFLTDF